MSAPNFTIEYWGDQISAIEFIPHLSTHDGHFNGVLGKALMESFGIPDWTLTPSGHMHYAAGKGEIDPLAQDHCLPLVLLAQDRIESLMDEALRLDKYLQAIKLCREKAGTV